MSYSKRISEVFRYAPEIPFDDNSKIVLISDCHRGDGSWTDSFAANRNLFLAALKEYNKSKFTYIELGDGDELWESTDFAVITKLYKDIFALMSRFFRDGRLYLLYGNHDMVKKDPEFIKKHFESGAVDFPGIAIHEGIIFRHKNEGYGLYLLHGHQADYFNDRLWKLSRFLVHYLWTPLERLGSTTPPAHLKTAERKAKWSGGSPAGLQNRLLFWSPVIRTGLYSPSRGRGSISTEEAASIGSTSLRLSLRTGPSRLSNGARRWQGTARFMSDATCCTVLRS